MDVLFKMGLGIRSLVIAVTRPLAWLPPLLARVSVGLLFLQTGWGKLHHLDRVVQFFAQLKIPAPYFQAHLVAFSEFFCGAFLLAGLLSRIAAIPPMVIMGVALATAKRESIVEFSDLFGLAEYLYIVILLWLLVSGPGGVSLDRFLLRRAERRRGNA